MLTAYEFFVGLFLFRLRRKSAVAVNAPLQDPVVRVRLYYIGKGVTVKAVNTALFVKATFGVRGVAIRAGCQNFVLCIFGNALVALVAVTTARQTADWQKEKD